MDEKDWLFLQTLYEKKNITQAAKSLYISQPALTGRIQHLEREFNCQILIRKPRGIEFSNEGEVLVRHALKALHELQETKDTIQGMQSAVRGTLRLGCSNIFAKFRLPALLRLFHEEHSSVEIKLRTGFSQKIYEKLLAGSLHIGIIRGDYPWPGSRALLCNEPYYAVSAVPIDLDRLPELPQIHYDTDTPLQLALSNWWFSRYKRPPRTTMEVDNVDTCLRMVQQGLGFALISGLCLKDAPELHTAKLLGQNGESLQKKTWLYYEESSLRINTVKAFVAFAKATKMPHTVPL